MNTGDTAWLLAATTLVLFMTVPGLAVYYGGLVRAKNVLSVAMQCFSVAAVVGVLWMIVGYSLAFGGDSFFGFIGNLEHAFLWDIKSDSLHGTIPEMLFVMFQMTFAIITPAVMVGCWVERTKYPAVIMISVLWSLLVYVPVCHWVWGDGGWLKELGAMDFAGGLVVHTSAGVAALVIVSQLGRRRGFPYELQPPHNPGLVATGVGMLWVGWFGFNGGSFLVADGLAVMALASTHFAACSASVIWAALDWIRFRKPSLFGTVTGVIAGLAAVTPAAGYVGPLGALILGASGSAVCFFTVNIIKIKLNLDDSLDVFCVHGLGGITGTLLVAFLCIDAIGGTGVFLENGSVVEQFGVQALAAAATAGWTALMTFVIVKVTGWILGGIRVDFEDELVGLDLATHGEKGYDF